MRLLPAISCTTHWQVSEQTRYTVSFVLTLHPYLSLVDRYTSGKRERCSSQYIIHSLLTCYKMRYPEPKNDARSTRCGNPC